MSFAFEKRGRLEAEGFNPEQVSAILSEEELVVISAGAGSGKTRVLTERYVYLCEQRLAELMAHEPSPISAQVEEIVAITFTKKAAREMRDRIRKNLLAKKKEAAKLYAGPSLKVAEQFWDEQIEALGSAAITTFHSFCQKIMQDYSFEAGVLPSFSVLDEVQARLLQADILDSLFEEQANYQEWSPLYRFFNEHTLKATVKEVYGQLQELEDEVDLLDLFNAEVMVKRAVEQEILQKQRCLDEFYQKAQDYISPLQQLLGELSQKKASSATGHIENILGVLENTGFNRNHDVEGQFARVTQVMPTLAGAWKKSAPALYGFLKEVWSPVREFWKSHPVRAVETLRELELIVELFGRMMKSFHDRYDKAKRNQAAMDFADLQRKAVGALGKNSVAQECRRKYKHFMIDEFQDTNRLQMSMLGRIQPDFRFIVGDGKQAIYRFRGGDVSLMKVYAAQAKARSTGPAFIDMPNNYRTCKGIIDFVNLAFASILGEQESDSSYRIPYSPLIAARCSEREQEVRVELLKGRLDQESDQVDEYQMLVSRMVDMVENQTPEVQVQGSWTAPKWKDMAILIPSRTPLTQLEMALQDRNIPYVVYGGIGFYEKQEVLDFLSLLRWMSRPWESLYIHALLRGPLFGLCMNDFLEIKKWSKGVPVSSFLYEGHFHDAGIEEHLREKLERFYRFYEQWVPYFPQTDTKEALFQLFEQSGFRYSCYLQSNGLQRIRNVEKLIGILADLKLYSFDQMLTETDRVIALSEKEGEADVELDEGDAVHIMTVHASKGLEFPIVFLPNLSRSIQSDRGSIRFHKEFGLAVKYKKEKEQEPHIEEEFSTPLFEAWSKQARDQALEESKRLFYVATTRARDYLVLSSIHKEKDKPEEADKTWYQMLQTALSQSESLGERILVRENEVHSHKAKMVEEIYEGPTLSLEPEPPIVFSVSEVMDFMNDPQLYYQKHVLKMNPEWLQEQDSTPNTPYFGIDASQLGGLVHRICECLDQGWPKRLAFKEALSRLEDQENLKLYERELEKLVRSYQGIDPELLGTPMENEWSFTCEVEGIHLLGTIDKVVRTERGICVIDLKTNRTQQREDLIEKYKPQLYLYKLAYEQIRQVEVAGMSLLFLRDGVDGLVDVPHEASFEQDVRQAVVMMADLKRRRANRAEYVVK
ncbi:exodeoxyribonuclease V subunit beta [Ammoniphilus sp. YIM 78166]|uniref:UvrD-helicase domain-containing protein n=1 Tax=Ammoniphilus sp. YIM 78166 TaxID=1644106 RepID=UPI001F0FDF51|nr:UvrD-helicase domain-containing protein [Ammoniphilus sp. YIM 78166]